MTGQVYNAPRFAVKTTGNLTYAKRLHVQVQGPHRQHTACTPMAFFI